MRTSYRRLGGPTETTIRRTLARLDAEALAAAIGGWLADRDRPSQRRRALDGKTLRGTCRDGRPAHLLAAMDHATRAVLAQRQVDGAPGEVPAFQPLLAGLDLAGVVVTADALHTHADAAEFLVAGKQAHDRLGQPRPARRLPPGPLGDRELLCRLRLWVVNKQGSSRWWGGRACSAWSPRWNG